MSNRKVPADFGVDTHKSLKIEDSDHDRMSVTRPIDQAEDAVLLTVYSGEFVHAAAHAIKLDRDDAIALCRYLDQFIKNSLRVHGAEPDPDLLEDDREF